jgi:hypothetical protein
MSSGSENANHVLEIIKKAETSKAFQGNPGVLSPSLEVYRTIATFKGPTGPLPGLNLGESLLVQNALKQTNYAAPVLTAAPSFMFSQSKTGTMRSRALIDSGLAGIIDEVIKGLTTIGTTKADITRFLAGTAATLNWWGWTLVLTQDATEALINLLDNDLPGLLAIATALLASVPELAAIAAILKIVELALVAWIKAEDKDKKGVIINGYLWIAVVVTPNT